MKKQLLYVAVLCSSFSMYAVVNEDFALENLAMQFAQSQAQAMYDQFVLFFRQLQDTACSTEATLEQVKELITQQLEAFKNTPNDDSAESQMFKQAKALARGAAEAVADVTRKNQLPAVDSSMLRKGVDAQATRLKVIEHIESYLK